MSEGRMAQIMPQGDGLRQILIQAQRSGDRPGDLRHLQGMRQPGTVVISLGTQEHLRLMFHSAKGFRVQDPVPVPLIHSSDITLSFFSFPSPRFCTEGCIGTEKLFFSQLRFFTYCH